MTELKNEAKNSEAKKKEALGTTRIFCDICDDVGCYECGLDPKDFE